MDTSFKIFPPSASEFAPAYDLLYEVHRVLGLPGERERVFGGAAAPPPAGNRSAPHRAT